MKIINKNNQILTCEINESDFVILKNALAEICYGAYAIEDFEFQTLMGFNRKYVGEVCKNMKKIIDDLDIKE